VMGENEDYVVALDGKTVMEELKAALESD
jgi:hypothetical protein